jgi:hypothetical protein
MVYANPRRAKRRGSRRRRNYTPAYFGANARGWFRKAGFGGFRRRTRRGKRLHSHPAAKTRALPLKRRRRSRKGKRSSARLAANPRRSRRSRRRRNYAPAYVTANPRRGRRGGHRRRRNPAIFGLDQLKKLPLVGEIFEQNIFWTGTGVALGVAFIPGIATQIITMAGIDKQTWYADKNGLGGAAVDVLVPVAVGALGTMAAQYVKQPVVGHIARGFAMAGIGIAVGTLLSRFVFPAIVDKATGELPGGMKPPTIPGVRDYLQEGDMLALGSVRDYLQQGDQVSDYLQQGDQIGSGYGNEDESMAFARMERTL